MKWRLDIISRNQVEFYLPKTGPGLNGLERTSLVNLVWQGGEGKGGWVCSADSGKNVFMTTYLTTDLHGLEFLLFWKISRTLGTV